MNPFDQSGPEFLLFYLFFSLVVIIAIVFLRRRAESGPSPRIDLGDPYLIAYLRGRENEALRVAVVTLVDRGLLVMDENSVHRADHVTLEMAKNPIEYEVLKKFSYPDKAASVFKDDDLKTVFQQYRLKLEDAGLIPNNEVRLARIKRLLLALGALGVVGLIKIQIGLSQERPVGFLVVMMIITMVIAAFFSFPRLTALGEATLADVTNLYSGLKERVHSYSQGSSPAELAMYAAVFGIGALAATPYGYAQTLFPRANNSSFLGSACGSSCGSSFSSSDGGSSCSSSSDSGSSCGSSSGGGSSCGGGGCGGCGS